MAKNLDSKGMIIDPKRDKDGNWLPTPFFRYISKKLLENNTKDELAKLLVKHQKKHYVSKAIASAYNKSVMTDWNEKSQKHK